MNIGHAGQVSGGTKASWSSRRGLNMTSGQNAALLAQWAEMFGGNIPSWTISSPTTS
jgi:hypothetical protein